MNSCKKMKQYEKPSMVVEKVIPLYLLATSIPFGEGQKKPEDSLAPGLRNPFEGNTFGNPFGF